MSVHTPLKYQKCVPCEGGTKPLARQEFQVYLESVDNWEVIKDETSVQKTFECKNFSEAVQFINQIAEIAESEGHHPDILLHQYKKLTVTLSTHAIKGLSINDFILASKIDQAYKAIQ